MPQSKDLFDDSTMTFGEHLEVLRVHLWKAIIGLVVCVILALFFGHHIVAVVREPIDAALQEQGIAPAEDDIGGFRFTDWLNSLWGKAASGGEGDRMTGEGLARLNSLKHLHRVDVRGTTIGAEALRRLKRQHPKLETAFDPLEVAGLDDWRGFGARAELDEQFRLTSLTVRDDAIDDDQIERLKSHQHLQQLDLTGTSITDDALELLKSLTALRTLRLRNTAVSDDGLSHLADLSALGELDLRGTAMTDEGLAELAKLPGLKRLAISGPELSDAALAELAKFPALDELDLRGVAVTDEGLAELAPLEHLKGLYLASSDITDAGAEALKQHPQLERLTLARTKITDAGLAHLGELPNLVELSFYDDRQAVGSAVERDRIDEADSRSITVSVQPSDLAAILHRADPEMYPEVSPSPDERPLKLALAAPEFHEFRETTQNLKKPVTLNVQEAFLMYLKVAFIAGLVIASPWVFYQLWLFVAAGLYPHERRYVHLYLPISVLLFLGGSLFCFFAVFPFVLNFLLSFNRWLEVVPQIRLSEWISFALMMPVMFGLSFQLPLVMLFLERISIFDTDDYRQKRRMAILAISIVSMLMTPADPMSMMLMMIPMLGLYEFGIWMCGVSPAPKEPFDEDEAP